MKRDEHFPTVLTAGCGVTLSQCLLSQNPSSTVK